MLKALSREACVFIEALLRVVPGRSGVVIRKIWFRRRFKSSGEVHIERGCEFVSPEAMSFEGVVGIGMGSFFAADGGSIEVRDNAAFNTNVHINASVGGEIRIGRWCIIGPNVVMRTAGHKFDNPHEFIRQQGHVALDIVLDDDVWVGANAVILGGVRVGKGAVIGAGAVVTKDVPPLGIVVGVPARVIKYRGTENRAE